MFPHVTVPPAELNALNGGSEFGSPAMFARTRKPPTAVPFLTVANYVAEIEPTLASRNLRRSV